MADKKVTELTPPMTGAQIAKNDRLYVADVSAGTSGSKSTEAQQLLEAERLWRNPRTLYVNDFYPAAVTAKADGTSNPLSDFYGSLAAAEADFPHIDFTEWGIELTDEVDWVAFMSASQYMFDNRPSPLVDVTRDYGHWKLVADGWYIVNKSIVFTCWGLWLTGSAGKAITSSPGFGATTITYNGPEGTDTAKVFLIDHYTQDDPGQRPPPPLAAPTAHPNRLRAGAGVGGMFRMTDMGIGGLENSGSTITYADSPSTSGMGFVVGVRLRDAYFADITSCAFGGQLLDAVWISSALWARVSFNIFYGIYRDSVSVIAFPEDFSTTVWIDDNEFGYYGRYAILLNFLGGVEPSPSVRRNSIEGPSDIHYYHTHLEEFVQGVRASICQVGGTYGNYHENRCEATVYQTLNMWGDLHLIGCQHTSVRDNRFINIVCSVSRGVAQTRTTAFNDFLETYNYVDITAERNIHAPDVGDYDNSGQIALCVFDGNISEKIINVAGVSISSGNGNSYRTGSVIFVEPETYSGTYITQVRAPGAGYVTMGSAEQNASFLNFTDQSFIYGPISNATYSNGTGNFTVPAPGSTSFGTWAADTVYNDKLRATNTGVAAGDGLTTEKWVYPLTWNGCLYEASATTGTRKSHATTEPTWPIVVGNTVVDNEVTWKCVRNNVMPYEVGYNAASMVAGKRHIQRGTAAPTVGAWNAGDTCWTYYPDPSTGVPDGWVCVVAGVPGTWIPKSGNYGSVALASLPAAATANKGCRALVTDSNATLVAGLGNTVASGGANIVPVYSDGSAWKIG
jgi:hypothetical protein